MTTKQLNQIRTVNPKSIKSLSMSFADSLEIILQLKSVTKGVGENRELLEDLVFITKQCIANCEAITSEK